jgi:5-methylcytosine-specific restriction endonuclease McrA
VIPTERECRECGEVKPLSEFSAHPRGKYGRRPRCKPCSRAYNKRYYREHNEEAKAARARYREENREFVREICRNWHYKNPEKSRENWMSWRENNRDKVRDGYARRRAWKAEAFVEAVDRAKVWDRDGGVCGICHEPADPENWHLDHVTPLSRGGLHAYSNVQVSHPFCNISKGAKMPEGTR